MTLQQLRYFKVMAEILHYTEAAKELYVSQSSLSYALAELEKELGAPLFEKKGRQITLSEYGVAFYPYAVQSLEVSEAGAKKITQMLQSNSVINLGYIYSLSFNYLPQTIKGFRSQPGNQDVPFKFFQGPSSSLTQKLKSGELDLAFSAQMVDNVQVCSMPIYYQDLYLVVPNSHPLSNHSAVTIADMEKLNYIGINPKSGLRNKVDDIFSAIGIKRNIVFEAEECNSMASFVSEGFGVTIMPEIPSLLSYGIKAIPINDNRFKREIYMIWNKEQFSSPVIEHFRSFVCRNMASDFRKCV